MRLSLRFAAPLVACALTFASCASTSPAAAPGATSAAPAAGAKAAVAIKGFAFAPATLEVAKGTVVTFTNSDSATHTVTSGANRTKDGKFDQQISGSAEASVTFDTVGAFEYFCQIHSSMKGTVTVK
jgi:plastocyanin